MHQLQLRPVRSADVAVIVTAVKVLIVETAWYPQLFWGLQNIKNTANMIITGRVNRIGFFYSAIALRNTVIFQ